MPDKEGKLNRAVLRDKQKKKSGTVEAWMARGRSPRQIAEEEKKERKERDIADFMSRYAKQKQGEPSPEFSGKYTEESINKAVEQRKAGFAHRADYDQFGLDKPEYQRAFDNMDDRTKLYSRLLYTKWATQALRGPKSLGGGSVESGLKFLNSSRSSTINPNKTEPEQMDERPIPIRKGWDKLTTRELEDKVKEEEAYMLRRGEFSEGRGQGGPVQGDLRLRMNPFPPFFKEHDKVMEEERKSFRHQFFAGEEEDASLTKEEEETLRNIPRQLGKDSR